MGEEEGVPDMSFERGSWAVVPSELVLILLVGPDREDALWNLGLGKGGSWTICGQNVNQNSFQRYQSQSTIPRNESW